MSGEQDFDDPWLETHLQRLAGDAPGGPATSGALARVARRARRLRRVRHLQHLAVAGLATVAAVATTVAVLPDRGGRVEMTADQGDPGIGTTDSRPPAATAPAGSVPTNSEGGAGVTPSPSTEATAATPTGPGDPAPPDANAADPGRGSGDGDLGAGDPTGTAPTAAGPPTTAPTTTAAATTTPATTAPTTTVPSTRTYAMAGGTVVIRWTASTLTLVSARPNPGFTEAREVQPTEIEISFTSSTASSKLHLHLSGGQLIEESEEG